MATNTEIKTAIDADITNKTLPSSITNTSVGERIKDVIDYVDQEISNLPSSTTITKQITVTLSSADLLALDTTPKLIIPGVTGKLLRLKSVYQRYNHNTTAYTHTGLDRFAYDTPSTWLYTIPLAITSASNTYAYQDFSVNASTSYDYTSMDIILTATSSITSGDGTLDLIIVYDEITTT